MMHKQGQVLRMRKRLCIFDHELAESCMAHWIQCGRMQYFSNQEQVQFVSTVRLRVLSPHE